jgi:hypothetical protein
MLGRRISEAAAAGLKALGLRTSEAAAAGFVELGLRMSEAAALGLTASPWARAPSATATTRMAASARECHRSSVTFHLPRSSTSRNVRAVRPFRGRRARLHFSRATHGDIFGKCRAGRAAPVRIGPTMARNLLPILLGILAPLATGAWLLAH